MTYKQNHISQNSAYNILSMSKNQIISSITVQPGIKNASQIAGIELEIEWDNPDCVIIHHFWLDPKIRDAGIGTIICNEIINTLQNIEYVQSVFISIQSPTNATEHVLKKCGFKNIKKYTKSEFDSPVVEGEIHLD